MLKEFSCSGSRYMQKFPQSACPSVCSLARRLKSYGRCDVTAARNWERVLVEKTHSMFIGDFVRLSGSLFQLQQRYGNNKVEENYTGVLKRPQRIDHPCTIESCDPYRWTYWAQNHSYVTIPQEHCVHQFFPSNFRLDRAESYIDRESEPTAILYVCG